ncbi:Stringent starvation protein B [Vibrio stylophorae]|uniref:Stringent starvation protein B n=1 Tax=Vibrio stylophorae TaxID=659351 RepID=A0ABM8ZR12_9VIBR|nr:ClpXP protease specificity-enhancing factor [Vibrio stylophorae]CAH0532520.1 Stringent starvation protein B [Vibrio stylophorae]
MMNEMLTARRPYLVRAYYDWLLDNDLTPHLVVDATQSGVRVPPEFISDGQVVLNIAPRAVGHLELGNDAISFNARFGGQPHSVIVPMSAVMAIYARENGAGTMFEPELAYDVSPDEGIVDSAEPELLEEPLTAVTPPDDEPPSPPRGRPSLRVVK